MPRRDKRKNIINLSEEELQMYLGLAKSKAAELLHIEQYSLGPRGWEHWRTKHGVKTYAADLPSRKDTVATKTVCELHCPLMEMYNLLAWPSSGDFESLMKLLFPDFATGTLLWSRWIPNDDFGAEDLFFIAHACFRSNMATGSMDREVFVLSLLTLVKNDKDETVGVLVWESIDRDDSVIKGTRVPRQRVTRMVLSNSGITFRSIPSSRRVVVQHVQHVTLPHVQSPVPTWISTVIKMNQSLVLTNVVHYVSRRRRNEYVAPDGVIVPSTLSEHIYHPLRKFKCVDSHWLYNRMQIQGGMLIIDVRPPRSDTQAIKGAIHLPELAATSTEGILRRLSPEAAATFSRWRLLEIVIYDDLGDLEMTLESWSYELCNMFMEEKSTAAVRYLSDGFNTFNLRYPHMLVSLHTLFGVVSPRSSFSRSSGSFRMPETRLMRTHSGLHTLTYPNEIIEDFLYLGNMWQASSEAVIKTLGITHVVNATLDCENVFENDGVKYLNVLLKDHPDSPIFTYFDQIYQFIQMARSDPRARVLVHCTQGISRSGTITIWYVMQAMQLSLVTAFNYVVARRGVVYPNLGFMQQLIQAEQRLYAANSIDEAEIESLLAGTIRDRNAPGKVRKHASRFDEIPSCGICQKLFHFIVRVRRQCKLCGRVVCPRCSSVRLQATPELKVRVGKWSIRVCDKCVSTLQKLDIAMDSGSYNAFVDTHPDHHPRNHLIIAREPKDPNPVYISWPVALPSSVVKGVIRLRFGIDRSLPLVLVKKSSERLSIKSKDVIELAYVIVNPPTAEPSGSMYEFEE